MLSRFRDFIKDDAGNGAAEYALVAGSFAVAMIGTTVLVTAAATGQMSFTYTGLDNRNGVTP
jgi:Flp pilus assembly pilin Flp